MKKIITLLLVFSFQFKSNLSAANIQVLFIGNSYVGTNNLPQVYYQLALSAGDTVAVDANSPGGYTLNSHSTNATTLSKINAHAWDFVVLQEQSQLPSFSPSQVATDVYPYARILDSLITLNHACSKTLFFMTWGRKYGDASNCANYPPVCTYAGMQQRLRESYLEMGLNNLAMVAPVGAAFAKSISLDSTLNLYSPDNSHPSMAGTYLAACVFYAATFQNSPVGISYNAGLSSATATFLQQVAHNVVLDSLATWHLNPIVPQSSFTFTQNGNDAIFTNTTLNGRNYEWSFGDGNFSTQKNPVHPYTAPGNYNVQLVSSLRCNSDTSSALVSIVPNGMMNITAEDWLITRSYKGGFSIQNNVVFPVSFSVYDLNGKLVAAGIVKGGNTEWVEINSSGMKLVRWQHGATVESKKIFVD